MAFASPIISDLLSLGTYAQDLYERCLLAPIHFREAKSELLALQTALSHLELLTKSPLFAAGGGDEAIANAKVKGASAHDGRVELAIEASPDAEQSNGNGAVIKPDSELDVASNGVPEHQISTPENSPHIPPKTRADIAQLAAGCRGVLQSFEKLLHDHRGLNDIPVKPKGRGGGGIMQLFVGRPTEAIDRYKFAQEGAQQVNAIRAKLTYHTGAITLMLTVLGSSSLGRIEGSLSKLETMIAAAAEARERVHTNNVNYYLLAQQNNLNISPEKQEYMRERQKKGRGMGPMEFQRLSEEDYYTSMNALGGGGMRGGGGPKMLKAKGEKQPGSLWEGDQADSDNFFSNINSWSGRPKSSGVPRRDSKASRDKPKEMGFLSSLSRRNTTSGAEVSTSRGARDESKKPKPKSDDWSDYMSTGWGDLRPKKSTKAQRLMLPPAPTKNRPIMSGGSGEPEARVREKEGKSSSSKRRERGEGKREEKVKTRRSKEMEENVGRIEELEDDEEEEIATAKVTEDDAKPEGEGNEETVGERVIAGEGGEADSPGKVENTERERDGERKSVASVKSKHSSKEVDDAAAAEAKADRHRKKKEREREKEKEREKIPGAGPPRKHGSSSRAPAPPPDPAKGKKLGWGESYFLNSWDKTEKKPTKPAIAIPVPKKNRSVVNLRHGSGRPVKGEDAKVKTKGKHVSSKPVSEEDKEKKRQRKEQRQKAKEGNDENLGSISEEAQPVTVNGEDTEKKDGEEISPNAPAKEVPENEEHKDKTTATGEEEGNEVGEEGEAAATGEDEAAKKERRRKRREAKEISAEGKDMERKPSRHHKSSKDKDRHESSGKSVEKGKEKERSKEQREDKHRDDRHKEDRQKDDREKREKLRRQNTEPITEKEKKEHKSRSKTMPVTDKKGQMYDYDKDMQSRRKIKVEKEAAQPPASPSLWNKKMLAVARLTMGGQKQEEARRKPEK